VSPSVAAALEIVDVRHRYGTRTIVDIPHLDVQRGETLGIIGPSGAGKSTLLRLLQGLERATEGHIRLAGTPLPHPAPVSLMRRITTVFQRPVMLDRTVRDNVSFGLRLRGRTDGARVDTLLERLALAEFRDAPARRLSGGEIQRVALARALATGAEVILLDEPAANLDPANVARVESLIRDEQSRGTTMVLVTHNTHEARRLAHRTLLMIDGAVVEIGPTPGFFDAPDHPKTRAFLTGDLVY
jgi:tungstate transport system ATP-binding protein